MIHVSGLSVEYSALRALDSVTLSFRQREFTVLLGRSGAGKSTLLRCLNYLQRPTRGTVEVAGIGPLNDQRNLRRHRRQTGTVFQLHHLLGCRTALQNVLCGRLGHCSLVRSLLPPAKADVDIALMCLECVGLLDKSGTRVDQLSGGERQRVGIARALCQQPTVILADEPVASLDPVTGESIMALLCRICRAQGLTLIMSLHQLEFARRHGERIIGLSQGRVVFDGPACGLGDEDMQTIYGGAGPSPDAEPFPGPPPRTSDSASEGMPLYDEAKVMG
jgi:phosphonate transport system ATP-binding protein